MKQIFFADIISLNLIKEDIKDIKRYVYIR